MKLIARAIAAGLVLLACTLPSLMPSFASQNSCVMPNTGTVSGLTLVNDINACNGSLLTLYSGGSAPSSPSTGMFWYDTGTNYVRQFDGTSWQPIWYVDATNHLTTHAIGGGITSASLLAAATTDIGSVPQAFVTVTGNTAISSFGSSAVVGSMHVIKFTGTPVLTYNATSLILPGAGNIVVSAGDTAFAIYLGSGNWQVLFYQPGNGTALVNTAIPLGTVYFGTFGTIPPKTVLAYGQALLRSTYPAYLAAVTRAQPMTRTAGNATLASVADTSGFGVGMPVEGPGIAVGCTIASLVANTSITLNNTSCVTANGSATITVFLTGYGSGGSNSTVGVVDCRGVGLAGRDDLGTVLANRLSNATANNSFLGSQTQTITTGNMPSHAHNIYFTDPGHIHGHPVSGYAQAGADNGGVVGTTPNGWGGSGTPQNTLTAYTGAYIGSAPNVNNSTTTSAGSGTAMSIVQPTRVLDCVQAVIP
jgi:hypothetical protein